MNLKVLKQVDFINLHLTITYLLSGIIINMVQVFLYVTLRRFSKYYYRKINYYLSYSSFSQVTFLSEWWSGSEIMYYINKDEFEKFYGKEHGIVIVNHHFEADWLMIGQFYDDARVLGSAKGLIKKGMRYVPVIGWSWALSDSIFLERSYEKDRETIQMKIQEFGDFPDPTLLLMFPEGTRFSQKTHEASLEFAKKNDLPLLKHHLTPRTKGFTTTLLNMNGKINAIYDINIAFDKDDKVAPIMSNIVKGNKVKAHFHISRIPIENVPNTEKEAAEWLHERFVLKDKIQESFKNTGDFFVESGVERILPFKLPQKKHSLINFLFWFIITIIPLHWYSLCLLLSGELLKFSVVFGIFGICYALQQYAISLAKTNTKSDRIKNKKT